ncbi:urea amidolyase-like [Chrysoperla carnea]|uniref:urea amidolyase-like n=1 Tax=Chrysoperla carnea TaxID=189513 RepID=UPI001D07159D|nr:urea amidolyase-like [Chrysoperla carnea]
MEDYTIADWQKIQTDETIGLKHLLNLQQNLSSKNIVKFNSVEKISKQWTQIKHENAQALPLYGVPYCIGGKTDNDLYDMNEIEKLLQDYGAITVQKTIGNSTTLPIEKLIPFTIEINAEQISEKNRYFCLKLTRGIQLKCENISNVKNIFLYTTTIEDLELIYTILENNPHNRYFDLNPKFAIPENSNILGVEIDPFIQVLNQLKELGVMILHRNFNDFYHLVQCLYQTPLLPERYTELKKLIRKRSEFLEPTVLEILARSENTMNSSEFIDYLRKDVIQSFDNSLNGFILPISNEFNVFYNELPAIAFPTKLSPNLEYSASIIASKYFERGLLDLMKRYISIQGTQKLNGIKIAPISKEPKKPFERVLIANRGEIAVRIIRTLKRMGIKSVSIYSKPDEFAPHVQLADEAVCLTGNTLAETYLNIEQIIEIAKRTKSEAIIPGYGFLSENAVFAKACEDANIIFVGPSAESINSLGLKHSAREIAKRANVPLVPGSDLLETLDQALEAADQIPFPIMIKSTAGGGGIGLQRCDNRMELIRAYETVRQMGQSYFKNSGVFIERFVDNARHVEVQIFGDGKGNAIHLGERDCSLQRRNQKVVEETPAPNVPEATRRKICDSAVNLAKVMKYKCAGTVEFMYDPKYDEFYFLEVNTRLQVEHPITEEVTGLDLVEWMLLIAADMPPNFFQPITCKGASMEVRLYAENPVKGFKPSPGQLIDVHFPENIRVDTWISKGTIVSADFDPLLAKIIVHGKNRKDALSKLQKSLDETKIYGIVSNIDYLRSIVNSEMFATADVNTKKLDKYVYTPNAIEILAPGSYTSVQDYPGRIKYWHIGVPPSGPMDNYAFQLANRIVGNASNAPAIEITIIGPTILFHHDAVIALTGGSSNATLDDKPIEYWTPIYVKSGQKLCVGKLTTACRSYLAIRGGLDVPEYLGSRSTFALGNTGGYNGRTLKFGDVIFVGKFESNANPSTIDRRLIPSYTKEWEVGVLYGPHGSPDFFQEDTIQTILDADWKVHYNSNRFGVRLTGPKPNWAREDGGDAGLHPSNTHDYVYSMGAVNFTGDEPVILTCDGPSLGGFVCPFTVAEAEMWKIGQVKPGDTIRFKMINYERAILLRRHQAKIIDTLSGEIIKALPSTAVKTPILRTVAESEQTPKITYRQSGDRYILIEYGENNFDIQLTYRIYRLCELIKNENSPNIIETSPGVRSVLIEFNGQNLHQTKLLELLLNFENRIQNSRDWTVPSRIINLPLAFEDDETLAAVQRYSETIRSEAPWLPNNVDFIQKVNGLESRDDVRKILYDATFLVLGLGDVFLGAPCAVPLDPRHRLLGTKYNPSRSFTPNGTVGIGGMYMCIYTMESPGGYQLVGRTVPIWDKLILCPQKDQPWLLNIFDQVRFYPVTQEKLAELTELATHGKFHFEITETIFDCKAYTDWLELNAKAIDEHNEKLKNGNTQMAELIKVANTMTISENEKDSSADVTQDYGDDVTLVYCDFVGRLWKKMVNDGDYVKKDQPLIIIEAMKAEMTVTAPKDGKLLKVFGNCGDFIQAGDTVAILE